jgi:protoporphyrinogen oxidase
VTVVEAQYLILGAGLAGLTVAGELGDRAVTLERSRVPGGLVRTLNFGGYWFDVVLHFLYFQNDPTEGRIQPLIHEPMHPLQSEAFVEFDDGVTRFPFQTHLATLPPEAITACLRDFIEAQYRGDATVPADYRALLLRTFGQAMCERFFFPYNEKMWRRPLEALAPSGFHWNLARPDLEEILRGAFGIPSPAAYNATGWYPRPRPGAATRGMEVLAQALARRVTRLHLEHTVESIDLEARSVLATGPDGPVRFRWSHGCVSTLPLPRVIAMCTGAPEVLRADCASLRHNRVRSVMLSIEGSRPPSPGHWRYYPSREICFTRLAFMCEFDPDMAPSSGWSLLAELPEPAEAARMSDADVVDVVRRDLHRVGILPVGNHIVDAHVVDADPAYVVFTPRNAEIIEAARAFLRRHGVEPLGRYGRWEYSSMAQVMRDALRWADDVRATPPGSVGCG